LNHLSAHDSRTSQGLLSVHAIAFVGDRGAVIAPSTLRQWIATVERRLNVKGLRVVDTPVVLIDVDRNEVVVPAPALEADWSALDDLVRLTPFVRPDPVVTAGRYALRRWAFFGDANISRAQAVALASRIAADHDGVQAMLEALAQVIRRTPVASVPWVEPAKLATALAELG
jgi:hypothetical protein